MYGRNTPVWTHPAGSSESSDNVTRRVNLWWHFTYVRSMYEYVSKRAFRQQIEDDWYVPYVDERVETGGGLSREKPQNTVRRKRVNRIQYAE